jgi:Erv1 / Alr family
MTAVWGPLGWMTLHSISVCYPEEPTLEDKSVLDEFMKSFAFTITCPSCNQHFSSMFIGYKHSVPSWNNSRRDLFLAICRMHNTVNKRLDKPCPKTVGECIDSLKNATSYTSPSDFRKKYIEYLKTQWRSNANLQIFSVDKLRKINESYWNPRDVSYSDVSFPEEDVLTYENQPIQRKIIFPRMSFRNIKWTPKQS